MGPHSLAQSPPRPLSTIPLFGPKYSGFIHLVDGDYELANSKRLGQRSVLACLTTTVETSFKLTLTSRNHQDTNIGLRRTTNHVGHVVLVAGRIENRVALGGCLKMCTTDLDSLALKRDDTMR
jgi:hypothetical protein